MSPPQEDLDSPCGNRFFYFQRLRSHLLNPIFCHFGDSSISQSLSQWHSVNVGLFKYSQAQIADHKLEGFFSPSAEKSLAFLFQDVNFIFLSMEDGWLFCHGYNQIPFGHRVATFLFHDQLTVTCCFGKTQDLLVQ